ncbi:MAG: hypothetical protein HQ519_09805 [Planctomycetes bacterium]|nr:hypothetical protein [Planctomycetota bacterium]
MGNSLHIINSLEIPPPNGGFSRFISVAALPIDADGYIRHRDLPSDDVAAEVRKLLMEMDD